MKKLMALLLAISLCALLFAACGDGNTETTPGGVLPEQTTNTPAGSETTNTSESTSSTGTPVTPAVPELVDNPNYDFVVRTIVDESGKIVGVAAADWKALGADTKSISFSSKYMVEDEEYPVLKIGIGVGVLKFQSRVESITIAAGVPEIADNAFTFCYALKELKLNEGLTKIGEMAFWNCGALETLVIPSTVTEIGEYAFADCASLKSVTLPRSFEGKTDDIFAGSKNVTFTFVD